jgi:hypothetical protein
MSYVIYRFLHLLFEFNVSSLVIRFFLFEHTSIVLLRHINRVYIEKLAMLFNFKT